MKGIVLAMASFGLFALLAIILLRTRPWEKQYRALLLAFPFGAFAYACGYAFTPPDLGCLGARWLEPSRGVDVAMGLAVYLMLFHCFWDFIYAVAVTGFSVGLMVKIERSMPSGATTDELVGSYVMAEGRDCVFSRRIPNLLRGGYIREEGKALRLTPRGRAMACVVHALQRLLNIGQGG